METTKLQQLLNKTEEQIESYQIKKLKINPEAITTDLKDVLEIYNCNKFLALAIFNDRSQFYKIKLLLESESDEMENTRIELSIYRNNLYYGKECSTINHISDKINVPKIIHPILKSLFDELDSCFVKPKKNNTQFYLVE